MMSACLKQSVFQAYYEPHPPASPQTHAAQTNSRSLSLSLTLSFTLSPEHLCTLPFDLFARFTSLSLSLSLPTSRPDGHKLAHAHTKLHSHTHLNTHQTRSTKSLTTSVLIKARKILSYDFGGFVVRIFFQESSATLTDLIALLALLSIGFKITIFVEAGM